MFIRQFGSLTNLILSFLSRNKNSKWHFINCNDFHKNKSCNWVESWKAPHCIKPLKTNNNRKKTLKQESEYGYFEACSKRIRLLPSFSVNHKSNAEINQVAKMLLLYLLKAVTTSARSFTWHPNFFSIQSDPILAKCVFFAHNNLTLFLKSFLLTSITV